MNEAHPSAGMLHRFMMGELPVAEMRRVLRHLLTRCPECREATASLWVLDHLDRPDSQRALDLQEALPAPTFASASAGVEPEAAVEEAADYDEVFERVFARITAAEQVIEVERAQGQALLAELLQHLPAHQTMMVGNSTRFRHRVLGELLLDESHDAGFHDPRRALHLARLAVDVTRQLGERSCGGAELFNGLRARAWAQVGNAWRLNSEHAEAEAAFAAAATLCADIDDVGLLDRARVLDLEASLRRDQRRFGEASRLLDRVIDIYERLGQSHLLGRALSQKATVCGEAGQVEAEIVFLRHALELLDPEEDARAFLNARHNLIVALHESGRSREAYALLFSTRPLYLKVGDRMSLVRLRWLEGRVALGLGRLHQSEAAFREVVATLLEMGRDYDAAGAALDLARSLALQGSNGALRRLAEEMLAALATRDIHREALAALACYWTAAAREQATIALLGEVAGFLDLARDNPGLRFARRAGEAGAGLPAGEAN